MPENKIVIVSDDGNKIQAQDITIKNVDVDRAEVANVKEQIAQLENQKAEIESKLVELKAKVDYAEHIIKLADEQKQAQTQTESTDKQGE